MLSPQVIIQIIIMVVIWIILDAIQHILELPLPASVLGLFILLTLLRTHIMPIGYVEQGGNFLLKHMLLFFIPPVVGLIQYVDILLQNGIEILIAIIIGTFMVMFSSKLTVQILMRSESN